MTFKPIIPKKPIINVNGLGPKLQKDLRDFGVDMQGKMEYYPPAKPWKNPPPKKGFRKGTKANRMIGKRTGLLKSGWARGLRMTPLTMNLSNRMFYGWYVQGPTQGAKGQRQTVVMRRRGWQSISEISKRTWPKYRTRIQKSLAGR